MNDTFGNLLRIKRRHAGVSQRDLADRIGCDFSYISKLENDRLPPPAADTVLEICRVLGVDPEELLALTGKIPSDVQRTVSTSKSAQEFLRAAQRLQLTDDEWQRMAQSLRSLRDDPQ